MRTFLQWGIGWMKAQIWKQASYLHAEDSLQILELTYGRRLPPE